MAVSYLISGTAIDLDMIDFGKNSRMNNNFFDYPGNAPFNPSSMHSR